VRRARSRFQIFATVIAAAAIAWLVLIAVRNGALSDLMVLHRDGPVRAEPVQALAGIPPARQAPLDTSTLIIPVSEVPAEQLTDTFAQARAEGVRRHDAIDIMAPLGTPVLAAAPGRVEKLFLSREGGNTVYIRSPDRRTVYYYAHLDSYAPHLREGRMVGAGEVLGRVGFSGNGNPDAPHLHFAIWKVAPEIPWYGQGEPVNPYPLLKRS